MTVVAHMGIILVEGGRVWGLGVESVEVERDKECQMFDHPSEIKMKLVAYLYPTLHPSDPQMAPKKHEASVIMSS